MDVFIRDVVKSKLGYNNESLFHISTASLQCSDKGFSTSVLWVTSDIFATSNAKQSAHGYLYQLVYVCMEFIIIINEPHPLQLQ